MEITNLKVTTPNGRSFIVNAEVEYDVKNGFQAKKITRIDGNVVNDNFILKTHISHPMIEKCLKNEHLY